MTDTHNSETQSTGTTTTGSDSEDDAQTQNGAGGEGGGAAAGKEGGEGGRAGQGEGGGGKGLFDGLSDEDQAFLSKNGFKADTPLPEVVKAYRNQSKLIGGDKLPVPPAEDPEALKNWEGWEKLGVPGSAEAYDIKPPELPEGMEWDKNLEGFVRGVGVEAKLAPFQMQALVDGFAKVQGERFEAAKARQAENAAAMQRDLKAEFGQEYEATMDAAKQTAHALLQNDDGTVDRAALERIELALGNSADLVRLMARVAKGSTNDRLRGGGGGFGKTTAEAKAERDQLFMDENFQKAYNDPHHQGHKAAVERMTALNKVIAESKGQ